IAELEEPLAWVRVEALLPHQLLAVQRPALGEDWRPERAPRLGVRAVGPRELEVVARVGLVQRRDRDAVHRVLAQDLLRVRRRNGDEEQAALLRLVRRRRL